MPHIPARLTPASSSATRSGVPTPQPFDSFYFAFVNDTTRGYGDILPRSSGGCSARQWR